MNTADLVIHVHPELDAQARKGLERELAGHIGVDCAEFDHHPHHHSLVVKYDPEAVEGMKLLQIVRKLDPAATMVGL